MLRRGIVGLIVDVGTSIHPTPGHPGCKVEIVTRGATSGRLTGGPKRRQRTVRRKTLKDQTYSGPEVHATRDERRKALRELYSKVCQTLPERKPRERPRKVTINAARLEIIRYGIAALEMQLDTLFNGSNATDEGSTYDEHRLREADRLRITIAEGYAMLKEAGAIPASHEPHGRDAVPGLPPRHPRTCR